jgi:hypothetical protein
VRKAPCCLLLLILSLSPVSAASADNGGSIVISEVYGGGGNTKALYANDFVELFNRSRIDVDLNGWAIGYSSKESTTWTSTPLRGTIPGYHYFLVRLGSGGSGGTASLPVPDVIASTNIARSAGKIRLTKPGGVSDLVGYGAANAAEGRPAPAPKDNTHSVMRARCVDTNTNAKDFRVTTPVPRNKTMSGNYCGSDPVLAPIGHRSVQANRPLTITVTATDKDNDPLVYSAAPLPAGARFTTSTRTFEWTPNQAQSGDHRLTFKVSDGYRSDTEAVVITVSPDRSEGRSEITLDVTQEVRRTWGRGVVRPSTPGALVTVKLFHFENRAYKRIGVVRTSLTNSSTYQALFARKVKGRCLMNAYFHGANDTPASSTERVFRC